MADLADQLEQAARRTAAARYAQARKAEQDPSSFRFTTDKLVNFAKSEPQYAPYYREFLTRDKAPTYSLDELAAAAPAFAPKKVAAAIQNPTAGQTYEGVSHDSEAILPPAGKVEYKKPQKATGATGAPPSSDSSSPAAEGARLLNARQQQNNALARSVGNPGVTASSLNNPALENLFRNQPQGGDWRDRAAAQAESLQNQYHGEPQMTGYHWYHGTGGVSGGNDAGMQVFYSDGSSNWVPTSKPGEFPPVAPTTQGAQNAMLGDATSRAAAGGGILPSWNSPTGQAVDLRWNGPKEIDTSAAGPTPPSGWLDRAISAARSGAVNYNTGAEDNSNFSTGNISPSRLGNTLITTPSGGTIGLPKTAPVGEGLENAVHGVRSAMEDRSALYNKIAQSGVTPPNLNNPKHEDWDSSQSGGNYGG